MAFSFPLLEICAQSLHSALEAQAGGAQRIELCAALSEGGITPSPATLLLARKHLHIGICVLLRPRGGDFCYTDTEFEVMKEDIRFCRDNGMDGVVLGVLRPDRTIDVERTAQLAALAGPMEVAFHRAFDQTPDPAAALEQLIGLGIARVLTSGQQANAWEGRHLLADLVRQSAGRITVMPGCGLTAANIPEIAALTGAQEFHLTAQDWVRSPVVSPHPVVHFSPPGMPENDYLETRADKVREVVRVLEGLGR